MPAGNTRNSFGTITKTFHWLTALLILIMIPLGLIASDMAQTLRETPADPESLIRTAKLFSLHKTLGVALFFIAIARSLWAMTQPRPSPVSTNNRQTLLADVTHWILYGSLILTPLAGWIHHAATSGFAPIWWPFGQSLPLIPQSETLAATFARLHTVLVSLLVLSILLHLAGVLKHQFWNRDATLQRMLPGRRELPDTAAHSQTWRPAAIAAFILIAILWIGSTQSQHQNTPLSQSLSETSSDWTVTNGTLNLTVTLFGSEVTGTFSDWNANITFTDRTTSGPAGQVTVTIAIPSLTLGSVTEQAFASAYFDAERFPTATFTGEIEKTEAGYLASGRLTIRDISKDIRLPFSLAIKDDIATMTAELSLSRLDFGIGETITDERSLGFTTTIAITLTAQRRP